jgi:hypothetical protein
MKISSNKLDKNTNQESDWCFILIYIYVLY